MGRIFIFEPEKAVEVLLYIAQRCPDMYLALKIVYYADKDHLTRYGRLICGDQYTAMNLGPVPSGTYDLVKFIGGHSRQGFDPAIKKALALSQHNLVPQRPPDMDLLSPSDVACLDRAIETYGKMSFDQLKQLIHGEPAYQAVVQTMRGKQKDIPLEVFVKHLPDGDLLWDYLSNY